MAETRTYGGYTYEKQADGSWKRAGSAQPQMPADPTFPYQGAQAAANVQRTQTQNQIESAKAPSEIAQAEANAEKTRLEIEALRRDASRGGKPDLTASEFANAMQGYQSAVALQRIIGDLEQKYAAGPGSTQGIAGLRDWLGGPANQQFDKAANAARGTVGQALGFIGSQLNSASEAQMNVGPFIPSASDWDASIEDSITRLRELQQDAFRRSVGVLGGIPDANGTITPLPAGTQLDAATISRLASSQGFNAMNAPRVIDTGPGTAAAQAGSTTGADPVNPEYQREYTAWVMQNGGRFTPEQYNAFRNSLDQKYGYGGQDYTAEGQRILQQFQQGGSQNLNIPPMERQLSDEGLFGTSAFSEQSRNNAVNNPVGAALAGATDMGGFGLVSRLAPDQMAALGDAQSGGMAVGQVLGSIGGTSAIGALGRNTLGRAAPGLLGGAGKAQFARNLATDATYGGIYGGMTGQDPLTSAGLSVAGSGLGQGGGKLLGGTIGAVSVSPAVQTLKDAGVRLTTGQQLGGFAKSLEDAMTSIPGIGDLVNARRREGFQDFNRAAFNEAGKPIKATVQNIGEQGVGELLNQAGSAYDSATQGVRVPFDTTFVRDLMRAERAGAMLPDDLSTRFSQAMENRVMPLSQGPELTGEQYQQAFRGLRGYRSEMTKPGFEQDYRDALTIAMDALTDQMNRGGGSNVVNGLRNADQTYRAGRTLERAVQAAKNGTGSGDIQVFTPAQLNTSATQAANKYGGGRQMAGLIDAGQEVLPSRLPDSGTARRVAMMALPAALGGGGGLALDTWGGTDNAMVSGLTLGALLAAGGTRGGQKTLNTLLFERPAQAEMIGRAIKKRSGLFGSAALPLLIGAGG